MRNFLAASDRRGWLLPEDKYIHTDTLARKIKLLATWTSSEYSCSGKIYLIKQPLPFTLSAPQPTDWTGLHMPIKSWCSVLVATVIKSIKPNCYRPLPNSSSLFVTRSKPWHGRALQPRSHRQPMGSMKPPAHQHRHQAAGDWQLPSMGAALERGKKSGCCMEKEAHSWRWCKALGGWLLSAARRFCLNTRWQREVRQQGKKDPGYRRALTPHWALGKINICFCCRMYWQRWHQKSPPQQNQRGTQWSPAKILTKTRSSFEPSSRVSKETSVSTDCCLLFSNAGQMKNFRHPSVSAAPAPLPPAHRCCFQEMAPAEAPSQRASQLLMPRENWVRDAHWSPPGDPLTASDVTCLPRQTHTDWQAL